MSDVHLHLLLNHIPIVEGKRKESGIDRGPENCYKT